MTHYSFSATLNFADGSEQDTTSDWGTLAGFQIFVERVLANFDVSSVVFTVVPHRD